MINNTYGLVVCGGQSSRMGMDKSMLNYHGQPQRYHLYNLLTPLCEKVYISCNKLQKESIPEHYNTIVDNPEYEGIGPMAALLSAFRQLSQANLLVVGCDYPYINQQDLDQLIKVKLEGILFASFYNNDAKLFEPLLTHYHHDINNIVNKNFQLNNYSLQSILKKEKGIAIVPENQMSISSIDTVDAYEKTLKHLRGRK